MTDPDRCQTCEDVEYLALCGEALEQIAPRVGLRENSLERHLYRHQRRDLLHRLPRLLDVPPTPFR